MRQSIIERLDSIPITDLFNKYHIDWQDGRNFRCPFPAHGATGATPSFRYYSETNSCACFGCHKGGGPVHFIMNMEGCTYVQACDKLMSMYGIEKLPEFSYQKLADKNQKKELVRDERLKFSVLSDMLSKIDPVDVESQLKFSFLYGALNYVSGSEYLQLSIDALSLSAKDFIQKLPEEIRNVQSSDLEFLKTFERHPFETDRWFNPYLIHSGYFSGVDYSRETQNGRYVFPIFLPGRFIVGFSGRTLNPNETLKYQTELNYGLTKKDIVYGLDQAIPYIRSMGYVIVVEGILDAVRCWSVGYFNTVAPCCAYVSDNIAILLKGLTSNFVLFQDNDYGGNQEAEMSENSLQRHGMHFIRLKVPSGEDPDSYGKLNPDGLRAILQKIQF